MVAGSASSTLPRNAATWTQMEPSGHAGQNELGGAPPPPSMQAPSGLGGLVTHLQGRSRRERSLHFMKQAATPT